MLNASQRSLQRGAQLLRYPAARQWHARLAGSAAQTPGAGCCTPLARYGSVRHTNDGRRHNSSKADLDQASGAAAAATAVDAARSDAANKPTRTLASLLAQSIREVGPLSVSTFMNVCLQDPGQGYYASANSPAEASDTASARDVLGVRGDFITSPEISQVFGELLAVFFVARWQSVNPSGPLRLVELGPGRGTLLADMLRTFSRFSAFFDNVKSIHLVESSPGLMSLQHDAISDVLSKAGKTLVAADKEVLETNEIRVEWFPQAMMVPIEPDAWTMVVAHEFFDALPSYIFERTSDGFREVLVDIERPTEGQSGTTTIKASDLAKARRDAISSAEPVPKFRHVLSAQPTPWSMLLAERNPRYQMLQPGQRVEISSDGWGIARRAAELVAGRAARQPKAEEEKDSEEQRRAKEAARMQPRSKGGVGVIVDYGDDKAFGGSFRAFKTHNQVDPLEAPGTADLTCNVDFAHLRNAVETTEARALGPMFQSHFLRALGLEQRLEALANNATDEGRRRDIESSGQRLVDPSGMGGQYKAFGIVAEAGGEVAQHNGAEAPQNKSPTKCYPFEM